MHYKDENGYIKFRCYRCNKPNTIVKHEYVEYHHRNGQMNNVCEHCNAYSLIELETRVKLVWFSPYSTEATHLES